MKEPEQIVRKFNRHSADTRWPHRDVRREWLVTNGLGGYAAGTLDGVFSRRYHGLLIAALPSGREMTLNGLTERVRLPDRSVWHLGAEELSGVPSASTMLVTEFRLEHGLPIWRYEIGDFILEKRLVLPYRQNTVHVLYKLIAGEGSVRLGVRPAIHFRSHDAAVSTPLTGGYKVELRNQGCEVTAETISYPLRLRFSGQHGAFTFEPKVIQEILFPIEEERGYDFSGPTWSPGYFRGDLETASPASLVASVEPWDAVLSLEPEQAWETELRRRYALLDLAPASAKIGLGRELVLAADAFLVTPGSRMKEAALARAEGEEAWTVTAGYHWFTDWGRDTMISLEGLALTTGRHREARWILRSFARHIRDGLIPNLFPEGADSGLYHTADATLWFFHALDRYVTVTGDVETLTFLLPNLVDIVEHHMKGTRFGIHADPNDGLLSQGEIGYQLTWMDAKVGDWVVTPRRGKAVEINALWYNALCLLAEWLRQHDDKRSERISQYTVQTKTSFNRRFWSDDLGHLLDVVDGPDGDDAAFRPNQILSFSLRHPVLSERHWETVFDGVRSRLLTPMGLRTLSRDHPDYKATYFGDLQTRDAAYHQGTVWTWLLGPFINAFLRLHPDRHAQARTFLQGFNEHLNEACVGSISEIFDAEQPYTPRGCVAQAWSVAEVLRCWALTEPPLSPDDASKDELAVNRN